MKPNGIGTIGRTTLWGICLVLLLSCSSRPPEEPAEPPTVRLLSRAEVPDFDDDLDKESLKRAISGSLTYFQRTPEEKTLPLGDRRVPARLLKESLLLFLEMLEGGRLDRESIVHAFDVYRAGGGKNRTGPLITGYYEPILEGRLAPGGEFCYPLYGVPRDLVTIDLASFDPERFSGERLTGRLSGNKVIPYYTRAEIDGQGKLQGSADQMVWLCDPVDVFFLHVQGSGIVRLAGSESRRVGYAAANGRPYRSIGKVLLEKGSLPADQVSLQSIRSWLRDHPGMRDEVLWHNESYVFFRWNETGPLGSLNVPLTAGRSVAMDAKFHPRGGLAFLDTMKPRLDAGGNVLGWEPLRRWVLNQDTGGGHQGDRASGSFLRKRGIGRMDRGAAQKSGSRLFSHKAAIDRSRSNRYARPAERSSSTWKRIRISSKQRHRAAAAFSISFPSLSFSSQRALRRKCWAILKRSVVSPPRASSRWRISSKAASPRFSSNSSCFC